MKRKKNLKKTGSLALAAVMLLGMAGCAAPALPGEESSGTNVSQGNETQESQSQEDQSQEQSGTDADAGTPADTGEQDFTGVTVRVWGANDILNNEAFEQYVRENGNGLTYEVVNADELKVMSMVATGTAPDVWCLSAFSHGAMYAARGLFEPLTDYIAGSDVFDEANFEDVENLYRFDGREVGQGPIYGIVKDWSLDNQIWVNKKVFEDANLEIPDPQKIYSWDDIREWAKACVEFDANGEQVRWGMGTTNNLYQLITGMVCSVDKSMFSDDLSEVYIDTPEIREAFEYWADMYKSGAAISDMSTPGDWGGDSFALDKVGMLCCGYWFGNGTLAFNENAKDRMDDFILIQAPSLDTSRSANACMAGVGASIWEGSKNKEAAFKFIELYNGGEWARERAMTGYGNPAQKDLVELLPQETAFQKQTYDANKFGMENMITLKTNPYITAQGMESTFHQFFYEVLYERMTMDDAIAAMQSQFEELLAEGKEICGID